MLSKNHPARYSENQKYLHYSYEIKTRFNQWIKRVKNTKEYKYFKCPECKVLLRLHRGCGEKSITCPKCSHQFKKKA